MASIAVISPCRMYFNLNGISLLIHEQAYFAAFEFSRFSHTMPPFLKPVNCYRYKISCQRLGVFWLCVRLFVKYHLEPNKHTGHIRLTWEESRKVALSSDSPYLARITPLQNIAGLTTVWVCPCAVWGIPRLSLTIPSHLMRDKPSQYPCLTRL